MAKKSNLLSELGEINISDIVSSASVEHGLSEIEKSNKDLKERNIEPAPERVGEPSPPESKEVPNKKQKSKVSKPSKPKDKLDISGIPIDLDSFTVNKRNMLLLDEDIYFMLLKIKSKHGIKIKPFVNEVLRRVLHSM